MNGVLLWWFYWWKGLVVVVFFVFLVFFSVCFVCLFYWNPGQEEKGMFFTKKKKKLNSLTESFQETTSDFQKENLKSCGPSEDYEQMYVCLWVCAYECVCVYMNKEPTKLHSYSCTGKQTISQSSLVDGRQDGMTHIFNSPCWACNLSVN